MSTHPDTGGRPYCEPGPTHPITVEPTGARVVVRVDGHVVAESSRALTLQEAAYPAEQYLPLDDVARGALRPSSASSYCPYKGEASYWTLVVGEQELADAVWGYLAPYPAVGAIAGHVAFYPERVSVEVG